MVISPYYVSTCLPLNIHQSSSKTKKERPRPLFFIVRVIGLEPTHLAIPDPKSGASTNFATRATYRCAKLIQKNEPTSFFVKK